MASSEKKRAGKKRKVVRRFRKIKVDGVLVEGRVYCPECDAEVKSRTIDYGLKGNNYYFIRDCSCGASVVSYCASDLKRSLPPITVIFRLKRREKSTRPLTPQEVRDFLKSGSI